MWVKDRFIGARPATCSPEKTISVHGRDTSGPFESPGWRTNGSFLTIATPLQAKIHDIITHGSRKSGRNLQILISWVI